MLETYCIHCGSGRLRLARSLSDSLKRVNYYQCSDCLKYFKKWSYAKESEIYLEPVSSDEMLKVYKVDISKTETTTEETNTRGDKYCDRCDHWNESHREACRDCGNDSFYTAEDKIADLKMENERLNESLNNVIEKYKNQVMKHADLLDKYMQVKDESFCLKSEIEQMRNKLNKWSGIIDG